MPVKPVWRFCFWQWSPAGYWTTWTHCNSY